MRLGANVSGLAGRSPGWALTDWNGLAPAVSSFDRSDLVVFFTPLIYRDLLCFHFDLCNFIDAKVTDGCEQTTENIFTEIENDHR